MMAYPKKTPAVQFHVDCSAEAKSRFATLHEALGFKTKAATFEAVLFAVSLKDKIDPQILHQSSFKTPRIYDNPHLLIKTTKHMGWEQIKELSNEAFRRLTGVQKPTFEKMIAVLREAQRQKTLQGGRPSKLCLEDRLLMSLEY
jgi:hypothetical protein